VNCATVRDVLPEFALGVAPGDDANAVELHVETCAACRKEAVDLQRAAVTFGYALAGNETPPETLEQTVVDAVQDVARPAKHPHLRGRRTGITGDRMCILKWAALPPPSSPRESSIPRRASQGRACG